MYLLSFDLFRIKKKIVKKIEYTIIESNATC